MKFSAIARSGVLLFGGFLLAACGGSSSPQSTGETSPTEEPAPLARAAGTVKADAGLDQTSAVGRFVTLSGVGSKTDADGVLDFAWQLSERPVASNALIEPENGVRAPFFVDQPGRYVVELTVSGASYSSTDYVVVATENSPPLARVAGARRGLRVGESVYLDATTSIDVDGQPLIYEWELISRPAGSQAQFSDPAAVRPALTPDKPGDYVVSLIVHDALSASESLLLTLATENMPPSAVAGRDRVAQPGGIVALDGSASWDPEGHMLEYSWSLVARPDGSQAQLGSADGVQTTLLLDSPGDYAVQLRTRDVNGAESVDHLLITTDTTRPIAQAGLDKAASQGLPVVLDGSGSVDASGAVLDYNWALLARPEGSNAEISVTTSATAGLLPDEEGIYVVQLMVSAAGVQSEPDTVVIAVQENVAPVSAPGQSTVAAINRVVHLDGSSSFDVNGDSLSFHWALIHRPDTSVAALNDTSGFNASLIPDVPGIYVAQLTVSDGMLRSEPKTVMIKAVSEATPETIMPGDRVIPFLVNTDADGDGVVDAIDNCVRVANAQQVDTDNDGYGNACDGDLDQNGIVDGSDSALLRLALERGDLKGDLNGDGVVDASDLAYFENLMALPPGPSGADPDMDMLAASQDNCYLVSNPDQADSDGDGFGNRCDADLNNDGSVNFLDLGVFRLALDSADFVPVADLDLNGVVDLGDLDVIRSYFFSPPGPSGLLPPTITPIGGQFVSPGAELSFQVQVLNPNQILYELAAPDLPQNASFDPVTGQFSFIPDATQLGLRASVIFSVTDGTIGSSRAVPIRVGLPGIVGITPANGETSVRNNRPIYVRFDVPVEESTVNATSIQAFVNDATPDTQSREQVAADVRLDFSGEIAVLMPATEWSTQASSIRVRVDGNIITDRAASPILIDADGDGEPGGIFETDFDTAPLTQIANSSVCGVIYDADSGIAGDPQPITGVRVSVEGLPSLEQFTDGAGFFRLDDVPVPDFFLDVDPSSASQPPDAAYLGVTRRVESIAGQSPTCEPGADLYEIFLYALPDAVEPVPINDGEDTSIGLGDAVIQGSGSAIFPDLAPGILEELLGRFVVTLPAGTSNLIDELAPYLLAPDTLPVPLPSNVDPTVVYGFAAFVDGVAADINSIDGDLAFVFPNVDGFLPGETHLVYAYDELAGDWLVVGTATVSADGTVLTSDAGFSSNSLGLHFVGPEGSLADGLVGLPVSECSVDQDNTEPAAVCEVSGAGELGSCVALVQCLTSATQALEPQACLSSSAGSCSAGNLGTIQACEGCDLASDLTPGGALLLEFLDNTRLVLSQMSNLALASAMTNEVSPADQQMFEQLLVELNDAAGGNFIAAANEVLDGAMTSGISPSSLNSPVQYAVLIDGEVVERGETTTSGSYQIGVPGGGEGIQVVFFDSIAWSFAIVNLDSETAAAGLLQIPGFSLSPADEAADSDSDGLADFAEAVLGTDAFSADSDGDGILDGAEVRQGLDPLSDVLPAMGRIGGVALFGAAVEQVSAGSRADSQRQTTYIATTTGMAVVDSVQADNPVVRSQLGLPGISTDIAVVGGGALVAVASDQGVHIVDVSDSLAPDLLRTAQPAAGAFSVEANDWQLFVGGQGRLYAIDAGTGQVFDEENVTGRAIDLAREGDLLYALLDDRRLQLFDISGPLLQPLGSVTVDSPVHRVFAGNDLAWISNGAGRGVTVIDTSNPALPVEVASNVGSGNLKTVLNGSGLAIVATGSGLEVYDASQSQMQGELGDLIATVENPPSDARSVAISAGIAQVADGTGGLQLVNFEPFDVAGIEPVVSILELPDEQPEVDGIQITEGSVIRVRSNIRDDVQVRNVELLVDGQTQANDVAFPFDLFADVPLIASSGEANTTLGVRATDTGGNVGNAPAVAIELLEDVIAPDLELIDPVDGSIQAMDRDTVRLVFSEPVRRSSVNGDSVLLRRTDGPLTQYTEPEVTFVNRDRIALLRYTGLEPGFYEISVDREFVTDRKGNPLSGGAGIETSEFQLVDSNAVWVSPFGGEWNDPVNWWGNALPGPDDDVYIFLPPGESVTNAGSDIAARNVLIDGDFRLEGGSASIDGVLQVNGTMTVAGGRLIGARIAPGESGDPAVIVSADGVFNGVVLDTDVEVEAAAVLRVQGGLELNGAVSLETSISGRSQIAFEGTQTLSGGGEILFAGGSNLTAGNSVYPSEDDTTLTIGPGITIRSAGEDGQVGTSGGTGRSVVNQGTIRAENGSIVLVGDSFINQGVIEANGAAVMLEGAWTSAAGTLRVISGSLNFGGSFEIADLGTVDAPDGGISITGTLENTGTTLSLNATSGAWQLAGGTIVGGAVSGSDGAQLIVTSSDGALVGGVVLDTDVEVEAAAVLRVQGGLELNGAVSLETSISGRSQIAFEGTQTLSGGGEILFAGGSNLTAGNSVYPSEDDTTLTIGPGITIRSAGEDGQVGTSGGTGRSVVNQGTIRAENGSIVLVGDSFINQGVIEANGAAVMLEGAWTSAAGTLRVISGSLNFGGSFEIADLGTVDAPDGGISITGTLENTGTTLSLNATSGAWQLAGGTIVGGAVSGSDGAQLIVTSSDGALVGGVVLDTDVEVEAAAVLRVQGGLELNGAVSLETSISGRSQIAFEGTQTLSGGGEILFAGGSNLTAGNSVYPSEDDTTLTIGPGITIRSAGEDGQVGTSGGTGRSVVNQGTIRAENGSIVLVGDSFINQGVIEANGAAVMLEGAWTSAAGTLRVISGSLNFGGSFEIADLGTVDAPDGGISITGTLENTGTTLSLNATSGAWQLAGGTIVGGAVSGSDGAQLIVTSSDGALVGGVVLDTDVEVEAAAVLRVQGGLELNGAVSLETSISGRSQIAFEGTQTLSGGGEILFAGGSNLTAGNSVYPSEDDTTLTIGPGITIRSAGEDGQVGTSGGTGRSVVNQGTIRAENGSIVLVGDSFINQGVIEANGAAVMLEGAWTSAAGTLRVVSGSLNLGGSFEIVDLGTVDAPAGGMRITGTLDNTGTILDLNATSGDWQLAGGTIVGGTVSATDGAKLIVGSSDGALVDGVVLDTDVQVVRNGTLTVQGGLELNGSLSLEAENSRPAELVFSGTQTLSGSGGEILFAGNRSDTTPGNLVYPSEDDTVLTIGLGITIRSAGEDGQVGSASGTGRGVVSQGTIRAEDGRIELVGDPFVNEGVIEVNGGVVSLAGSWTSAAGTLRVVSGSLNLGGSFEIVDLGTVDAPAGGMRITGTLENTGTTLALNATSGDWQLSGGTIVGGTVTATDGAQLIVTASDGELVDGVVLDTDVQIDNRGVLTVLGGLELSGTVSLETTNSGFSELAFEGTQTLSGNGEIVFAGNRSFSDSGNFVYPSVDDTVLTIGPGITIRSGGGNGQVGLATGTGRSVVNQGRICAEAGTILLVGDPFVNEGTIKGAGSGVTLREPWINVGMLSSIGPASSLTLEGDWSNGGTLELSDEGILNLGGTFALADLGNFTRSGGTLNVTGTLENTGTILDLNAMSGDWQMAGGTIVGGTVSATDGAKLIVTSTDGELVGGVVLNADVQVNNRGVLTVLGGLELGGTVSLETTNSGFSELAFEGTQTLSGNGEIVFAGNRSFSDSGNFVYPSVDDTVLTIGPGITIRSGGGNGQVGLATGTGRSVVNQGRICAEAGTILLVGDPFVNEGTIKGAGSGVTLREPWINVGMLSSIGPASSLTLEGDWSNGGTLELSDEGILNLGGTFALADLGNFTRSGGTLNVTGTLENTGTILDLNAMSGDWQMAGGTIVGGTVSATDGAKLIVTSTDGELVGGVVLNADVQVNNRGVLTVLGGLELGGTVSLETTNSGFSELAFEGTQTLSGNGEIVFAGNRSFSDSGNFVYPSVDDTVLTIGPGITIRSGGGNGQVGLATGTGRSVVNQGRICAEAGTILLVGDPFVNEGLLEAANSADMSITGLFNAAGTIASGPGSVISVSGDLALTPDGIFAIEIGGIASSDFGRIAVAGALEIDGGLNLLVVDDFIPAEGQMFQILAYASRSGVFDEITGGDIGDALVFVPVYGPDNLSIEVQSN